MQYDVRTPEEYVAALADDWRRGTLSSLRRLIKEGAPELEEGIKYKMLSYEDDDGQVFGLNAQKHYVGLYVGDAGKVDPTGEFLAGLDHGKGSIRFTKSIDVSQTRIDEFISRTAAMRRKDEDIDC